MNSRRNRTEYQREYRAKNRDRAAITQREYRKNNPERVKQWHKTYVLKKAAEYSREQV